jgi:hypothetical protein
MANFDQLYGGRKDMAGRLVAMVSLLALAACGGGGGANNIAAESNAGGPAAPAGPAASPAQVERYARCSVTMIEMGNMYGTLARRQSGAEQQRTSDMSVARARTGSEYEHRARELAAQLGDASSVDGYLNGERTRLRSALDATPFEQYASDLGRAADSCTAELGGS